MATFLSDEEQKARMDAASHRIQAVITKIDTYNRAPSGGVGIGLNIPAMEMAATVDLLVRTLIDAGVIDEGEFVVHKTEHLAEAFERAWGDSAEQRRQAARRAIIAR